MSSRTIFLKPYERDEDQKGSFALAAFLILAVGAFLRFYQLGAPSMWTDEMLVALNASHSVPYILSLAEKVEVHPPYFYFLYKIILAFGNSDFWLRLPSAVFGALSLAFLWRAGERHLASRYAALAATAILAVHPLHIWISRQVRPYALIGLMAVLALWSLLSYLENGRARHAGRNLLACLPMVMVHYLGLVVLAAQWLAALACSLTRAVPRPNSLVGYGAGSALCALPVAYFFWAAKVQRDEAVIASGKTFEASFSAVVQTLGDVLSFGSDLPWAWTAPAAFALLGAAGLAARGRVAGWLLILALLPPALLVAARYASHLYAVHLSFLLPALALLMGAGLDWAAPRFLRRPWFAVALCLCLGGAFLGLKGKDFYDPKGVVATWWHMGHYKDIGRVLRANYTPRDMIAFHDMGLYRSVDWYARQAGGPGAPSSQELGPDSASVLAAFVTNYSEFGHVFKNEDQFREMFGESAGVANLDNVRVYQAAVARKPVVAMSPGKGEDRLVETFTAAPTDVYARAWSLKDLTLWPYFGSALLPTKSGEAGEVVYRLSRPEVETGEEPGAEGVMPRRFCLLTDFEIQAPGNLLRVEYRFDQEAWTALVEETHASRGTCRLARFDRDRPFDHLWLRAVLRADEKTATSGYGGLDQVRLSRLVLFEDREDAAFGSRTLAVAESGLGKLEFLPGKVLARWGLGQGARLGYSLESPGRLAVRYGFVNRIPGQRVEVLVNGQRVGLHEDLEAGREVAGDAGTSAPAGPGTVEFRFSAWNHKDSAATFAPDDPRDIAVLFTDLSVEAPGQHGPLPPPQALPN